MTVKSPLHFRYLIEDSPVLNSLLQHVMPYKPQFQHLYMRCQALRTIHPSSYYFPHGFLVTKNINDDADVTFTRHFNCTYKVLEYGSRLKSLQ